MPTLLTNAFNKDLYLNRVKSRLDEIDMLMKKNCSYRIITLWEEFKNNIYIFEGSNDLEHLDLLINSYLKIYPFIRLLGISHSPMVFVSTKNPDILYEEQLDINYNLDMPLDNCGNFNKNQKVIFWKHFLSDFPEFNDIYNPNNNSLDFSEHIINSISNLSFHLLFNIKKNYKVKTLFL